MSSRLVDFNTQALLRIEAVNTKSLDDFSRPRDQMATASEIGGCFRKTVMKLLQPVEPTAKELRQKRRGHIFEIDQAERLVAMGFREVTPKDFEKEKGPCFTRQFIVEHPKYPIGTHLDFLIKQKDDSLHDVECKTTNGIPWEPYGNWIDQHLIQLGLIAERFPKSKIRGSILAADLSAGNEQEFNSFSPPNSTLMDYYIKRGLELVDAKAGKEIPSTLPGILCGYCPYRAGCPSHCISKSLPEEILKSAEAYEKLKRQKETLEYAIEVLGNEILGFTGTTRSFYCQQDGVVVTTTVIQESTIVDGARLKAEEPETYKKYSKARKGYTKLEVSRIQDQCGEDKDKAAA